MSEADEPAGGDSPGVSSSQGGHGDRRQPMAHPLEAPRPPRRPRVEERRPVLERLGLAAVAAVLGLLFGAVAVAAYAGGELFLAIMAGIGCLMTLWVGALTIVRG